MTSTARPLLHAAALLMIATTASANEPGSGVYATDCKATDPVARHEVTIDIAANGSATVKTGGVIYPDLLTSYSFFGDKTPAEFRVAVMFTPDATPLPPAPAPMQDSGGWIEIWNGKENFFALENGLPDHRLSFCGDLAMLEAPKQSLDCAAAATGVGRLICDTPLLAATDTRLAEIYAAARDNIDKSDLSSLEEDQADWTTRRDACGSTPEPRDCLAPLYKDRIAYLQARYGQASAGVEQLYACHGSDITELRVIPFDTDPPTVALFAGESEITALLRPSASGSRYEAPSGEIFWSKGAEALLEWPRGTQGKCIPK